MTNCFAAQAAGADWFAILHLLHHHLPHRLTHERNRPLPRLVRLDLKSVPLRHVPASYTREIGAMGILPLDPYLLDIRRQPSQEAEREPVRLVRRERTDEELAEWFERKLVEWPKR